MAGFSLIEVLVTIVVISIGLLGIAALQVKSVTNSYASYQRALANLQAQDALERLWANRCALAATPSVLATVTTEWQSAHASGSAKLAMPGWSGAISTQGTPGATGTYSITVSWTERSTLVQQAGTTQTYTHIVSIPFLQCT